MLDGVVNDDDIILGCDAMKELQFDVLYHENIPKIRFEQEVKIDCKPRGFNKYTFKVNSLLLKR
jgi:hypothetical protein